MAAINATDGDLRLLTLIALPTDVPIADLNLGANPILAMIGPNDDGVNIALTDSTVITPTSFDETTPTLTTREIVFKEEVSAHASGYVSAKSSLTSSPIRTPDSPHTSSPIDSAKQAKLDVRMTTPTATETTVQRLKKNTADPQDSARPIGTKRVATKSGVPDSEKRSR